MSGISMARAKSSGTTGCKTHGKLDKLTCKNQGNSHIREGRLIRPQVALAARWCSEASEDDRGRASRCWGSCSCIGGGGETKKIGMLRLCQVGSFA